MGRGGVRIVAMATLTSLKRACALCLNGSFVCAEVKANNSPGSERRRHFVRSECQNRGSLISRMLYFLFSFLFSAVISPVPPHPSAWAAAVTDLSYINTLITRSSCGGELDVAVSLDISAEG